MSELRIPNDLEGRRLLTPERAQHDVIEFQETMVAGARRAFVASLNKLRMYHGRRQLGDDQEEGARLVQVGEAYEELVYLSGRTPLPSMGNLMRVDNSRGDMSSNVWAREKLDLADEKLGPIKRSCVFCVCVEGWSAAAWAKANGYLKNGVGLAFLVDSLRILRKEWEI